MSKALCSPCNKQKDKPGGCALRGAKLALQPITDVIHVVHGSAGCLGHVWSSRPTQSSDSQLHRLSITSGLKDVELVMGGANRLHQLIDKLSHDFQPKGIFIYQSCLTAMLGEDLVAECKIASQRLKMPVIAIDAPGFAGGKQKGHQIAVKSLCQHIIGSQEPALLTDTDINIIGEFNVMGEIPLLTGILNSLGIRILASIPGDGRLNNIATAHRARLNLDLCSQAMPGLVEQLAAEYSIPFIKGSLYGTAPFSHTLKQLAAKLVALGADNALITRTSNYLTQEKEKFEAILPNLHHSLQGKRVLIYLGGVKTWALINDLQSAGLVISGISLHKCNEADKHRHNEIKQNCRDNGLPNWEITELESLMNNGQVDVLLSGGGMKYMAQKYAIPCIEMSHERQHSLLGFDGVICLLNEIAALLQAPVFNLLSSAISDPSTLQAKTAAHETKIIFQELAGSIRNSSPGLR